MAKKAYYIGIGKTAGGKDLYYKFYAGSMDYQGLLIALGVYESVDSATSNVTTAGTFSDYPSITLVRLKFKAGGSIVRLADTSAIPLALGVGTLQGGPNNFAIEEIKFVRQRRRK